MVSFRILLVTEGGAAVCGGKEKGGLVSMSQGTREGSVVSGVMLEIVVAAPPQFITHSCIVSKLFSFPGESQYKVSYYTTVVVLLNVLVIAGILNIVALEPICRLRPLYAVLSSGLCGKGGPYLPRQA